MVVRNADKAEIRSQSLSQGLASLRSKVDAQSAAAAAPNQPGAPSSTPEFVKQLRAEIAFLKNQNAAVTAAMLLMMHGDKTAAANVLTNGAQVLGVDTISEV